MKKILIINFFVFAIFNINFKSYASREKLIKEIIQDTTPKINSIFSMTDGNFSSFNQESTSLKEEKKMFTKSYKLIQYIDSSFKEGKEIIRIKITHYCLRNSVLRISKEFNFADENKKDFITHEFVSKVVVIKNSDTIFNRVIKKNDFNNILEKKLKNYATLLAPNISKINNQNGEIILHYSISIPVTDLGDSFYFIIKRNGSYSVQKD